MDKLLERLGRLGVTTSTETAAMTVLSSAHGRQRRAERGIEKLELQAAVKYGRRERAHPSTKGEARWRITHKGVVYITDVTTRHEITSWRLNDMPAVPPAVLQGGGGGVSSHTVLVVDRSGSMRLSDVPGHASRTAAVYDCLATQLIAPQLELSKTGQAGDAVVSLIESALTSFRCCRVLFLFNIIIHRPIDSGRRR